MSKKIELEKCPICHEQPEVKHACGEYFVECSGGCESPMCDHSTKAQTASSWNDWAKWYAKTKSAHWNGCRYCNDEEQRFIWEAEAEFKYCPMCGRKLGE